MHCVDWCSGATVPQLVSKLVYDWLIQTLPIRMRTQVASTVSTIRRIHCQQCQHRQREEYTESAEYTVNSVNTVNKRNIQKVQNITVNSVNMCSIPRSTMSLSLTTRSILGKVLSWEAGWGCWRLGRAMPRLYKT